MPGYRMAVTDPAREERARRARALGCDASKGAHIEAQGEFGLRRRVQLLEEELAVARDLIAAQRDVIAEQELALVRERSRRPYPVEPMGVTTSTDGGW